MASASAMPRAAHASRESGPHILYHSLGKELCRNGYQPCRLRKEGKPGPSGGTRKGLKRGSPAGWASGMRRASPVEMRRKSSEQERIDREAERQRPEDDSAWLGHDEREEEWKPEPELWCRRPSLEKWLVQKTGLGQRMESTEWHTFSLDNQRT